MKKEIIPAILTDTLVDLKDKIRLVEDYAATIQIDYVDGYFAPELTCCEASVITTIETKAFLEVQLMMEAPDARAQEWIDAGVGRLIGHIEKMRDQEKFVTQVSNAGIEVGLGLKLETPLEKLKPHLIDSLDVVLLMAHKVGVSGSKLDTAIYPKARALRKIYPNLNIEVDGGVTLQNAPRLFGAGANWLAVGSGVFNQDDPRVALQEFQQLAASD